MSDNEAVRLGDSPAFARLQERLAERGITPAEPSPEDFAQAETPAERMERMQLQHAKARTCWEASRPPMYATANVADLDEQQQPAHLAAWVHDPDALTLVLAGPVGTGKTYAAYAVGNLLDARLKSCQAFTVHDLLEAMRPDGGGAPDAAHVDMLLLDDLGAGAVTDWAVAELTALVDQRLREHRRTIVTTNLTEDQIQKVWGDRLADRLRHNATALVLRGQSRRAPTMQE